VRHTEQIRQIRKIRQIRDHALPLAAALRNRKNTPGKRISRILQITRIVPQRGLFQAPGPGRSWLHPREVSRDRDFPRVFTKVISALGADSARTPLGSIRAVVRVIRVQHKLQLSTANESSRTRSNQAVTGSFPAVSLYHQLIFAEPRSREVLRALLRHPRFGWLPFRAPAVNLRVEFPGRSQPAV